MLHNRLKAPEKPRISEAEKEAIIEAFFKKKADEARIFLENNPLPEELLARFKKNE